MKKWIFLVAIFISLAFGIYFADELLEDNSGLSLADIVEINNSGERKAVIAGRGSLYEYDVLENKLSYQGQYADFLVAKPSSEVWPKERQVGVVEEFEAISGIKEGTLSVIYSVCEMSTCRAKLKFEKVKYTSPKVRVRLSDGWEATLKISGFFHNNKAVVEDFVKNEIRTAMYPEKWYTSPNGELSGYRLPSVGFTMGEKFVPLLNPHDIEADFNAQVMHYIKTDQFDPVSDKPVYYYLHVNYGKDEITYLDLLGIGSANEKK